MSHSHHRSRSKVYLAVLGGLSLLLLAALILVRQAVSGAPLWLVGGLMVLWLSSTAGFLVLMVQRQRQRRQSTWAREMRAWRRSMRSR